MNHPFTDREVTTIRCALEIARDKYRENATYLRTVAGHERLAEQFDQQAVDAEDLLEVVEY